MNYAASLPFLFVLSACASVPTDTAPKEFPTPTPMAWRVDVTEDASRGEHRLVVHEERGPIALDLNQTLLNLNAILAGSCGPLKATFSNLDVKTDAVRVHLNERGDVLMVRPTGVGEGHIHGVLTFESPEHRQPDPYAELDDAEDTPQPSEPTCDSFLRRTVSLPLDIHVLSDVPSKVVLLHPGTREDVTSLTALPGANVRVSYRVLTTLGHDWRLDSEHERAELFPEHEASAFQTLSFQMPSDGADQKITSSRGDTFSFEQVAYPSLRELDTFLTQRQNGTTTLLEGPASTRADVHVRLRGLRAERPVNFLHTGLYDHLTLQSRTPSVCVAEPASAPKGFWPATDPLFDKNYRLVSEDFGDVQPLMGTLHIKGPGTCTFTTAIGGATREESFTVAE